VKKRIISLVSGISIIGAAFYGYHVYAMHYPSTDNAYVTADVVHVAPQVSGRVSELLIHNQDYVHKDQVLYKIDPKTYQIALEKALATLQQARQDVAHNNAIVSTAKAEVKRQEVLLENATSRAKRNSELKHNNYVSRQAAEDAEADKLAAKAGLEVARAHLNESIEQLGQAGDDNQAVISAKAALDQAQWELDNTAIKAPCDGRIVQLGLQPGDAVQTGQANFVLICDHQFWIDANFKETELARIKPKQPADIKLDMYAGVDFKGEVESINGASGVAFSLLPPQNASGNWVKITQRVPIRIRVISHDQQHPLLVGTSAHVRIDTRH